VTLTTVPQSVPRLDYELPLRTLRQIYALDDSQPYQAQGTSNIDLAYGQEFSDPVGGNTVSFFTSGKAYFAELITAVRGAKEEVLIAGWQINWDAQLAVGMRLYDLLLEVAKKPDGPKIYVMPWDNSAAVETYAKHTEKVLLDINWVLGGKPKIFVHRSASLSDEDQLFFSHHQKQVVIDRKIGFIGGIDIAYGRYDDETYTLKADADGRDGLNRYNSCIPAIGRAQHAVIDPDLLDGWYDNSIGGGADKTRKTIAAGGVQGALGGEPTGSLDPARQPRMPWQDLQQKIDGPAAVNLALNFVLRWNIGAKEQLEVPALAVEPAPGKSGCSVQVLRSASASLRSKEAAACGANAKKAAFPHYTPSGKQDDIKRAMCQLIEQSQHYIYIENQFFTTAFGNPVPPKSTTRSGPAQRVHNEQSLKVRATRIMPGDADGPIKNDICKALAQRIWTAIVAKHPEPFHVYIVLPVHPEGHLNDGPTMTQIHWTMQSLAFGSHSLINRIKEALQSVGRPETDWTQYLTLLNLRNWAQLTNDKDIVSVVTEQIYVHTKLMIVDDRYVVHGSANINDRSLLGSRDSELAVLIHDSADGTADLCGTGDQYLVLKHAQSLRKAIWRKLFGLDQQPGACGGAAPASALEAVLDKPAAPATVAAIQALSKNNQEAYESVFSWIPRNKSPVKDDKSSIWPLWNGPAEPSDDPDTPIGSLVGAMPFDPAFWAQAQISEVAKLQTIKGFVTALPYEWTMRENNNVGYHVRLVAQVDSPLKKSSGSTEQVASTDTPAQGKSPREQT
jgi:phospholipase D1/2